MEPKLKAKPKPSKTDSSRRYDRDTERVPVHSTPNILLWNRVLRYADEQNMYTAHALDRILEAGLNQLEEKDNAIV